MKTADATKDHTFKTLGFFNFDTDTAMLPGIGIILCNEMIFTDLAYILARLVKALFFEFTLVKQIAVLHEVCGAQNN